MFTFSIAHSLLSVINAITQLPIVT
jgi:hypothetical protein